MQVLACVPTTAFAPATRCSPSRLTDTPPGGGQTVILPESPCGTARGRENWGLNAVSMAVGLCFPFRLQAAWMFLLKGKDHEATLTCEQENQDKK